MFGLNFTLKKVGAIVKLITCKTKATSFTVIGYGKGKKI